ncbi:MAG: amidohydrolase [Acidobacteriota bacterium]
MSQLRSILIVALLFVTTCTTQKVNMPADLILTNGDFWTANPSLPRVQAIAISGGRIAALGTSDEIASLKGAKTEVIDLRGRFALPGFIDGHTHFVEGGFSLLGIDLRQAKDETELARLIGERAREILKGAWITGGNWDHESWPSQRLPTRHLIDPVTPDTPVFVDRLDGHMALANSYALRLAKITRNTPDPKGGEIVRNDKGEPTGLLRDAAMDLVARLIPEPSEAERTRALLAAVKEAGRLGVTSVNAMCSRDDLTLFQDVFEAGNLTVRIYAFTPLPDIDKPSSVRPVRKNVNDYLRTGGVKGFMDGSLGSTTAWFYKPYLDAPKSTGLPAATWFPEGNMKRLIEKADTAGLQIAVHAIGDRANEELLDIYEYVESKDGSKKDRRFRIEHAQHLAPQSIDRFHKLGVIASMQPYHLIDDGRWAAKRIGPERLKTTYAFRSLLDKGTTLAFGSDWPVAPLDPLLGVYAAVTRQTLDGKHPEGWLPEQKISAEEALTCYTRSNAYAMFAESLLGSLAVGHLADITVLSDNPMKVDPVKIKDIKVIRTIVGGRSVYLESLTRPPS